MNIKSFFDRWSRFLMVSGVAFLSVSAIIPPAVANVEIVFSDYLQSKMIKISYHDKKREEAFREYRAEGNKSDARAGRFAYRNHRVPGWANENLIPNIDNYDVPSLIQAMMERGLKEADPDFDGTITVNVERLKVVHFPFIKINSSKTQMAGNVQVKNAAGDVVAEHHIVAYLSEHFSRSRFYDGPDYVYQIAAANTRIGPIATKFTEKVLEKIFPGYNAPGPHFM